MRLHGRNAEKWFDKNASVAEKYDYLYSAAELKEWVQRVREIASQSESIFVITNNHFGGKAVANAFQLARELVGDVPEPPRHLQSRFPELA